MKKHLHISIIGILLPILLNAQWTSQATGFSTPNRGLWDISIADENTVWGIAYDGVDSVGAFGVYYHVPEFTRTTDGGATWIPGTFPTGYYWSNISAINADTAWISVVEFYDGAIFKTTDGGATWNEQGAGVIYDSTSYANFVHFWNANDGVTMGDPNPGEFEIYTTADGGANWTPVSGSAIPDPIPGEIGIFRNYCVIGNDVWFSTSKLRVYHSADKGLTWTVGNTGIPPSGVDYVDIAFWNANEGIARRYDFITNTNLDVVKTTDGGATWNPITVSGTFFGSLYSGIAYVPGTTSTLVSTGAGGGFGTSNSAASGSGSSYSNDGGSTWTLIDTNVQHYVARFLNNNTGWSAGFSTNSTSDGIFKYTGAPLKVQNTLSGKEIFFNAYPNPGNGQIIVQLTNGESADLKLSVLDLSGKTVWEQDFGAPGEFFLRSLDLSALAKGVYVLKIENGILMHSEKIVIR